MFSRGGKDPSKDARELEPPITERAPYNPYEHRDIKNPITYWMALQHFLKGCLGSGILGMGIAIKHAGWLFGVIATPLIASLLTYSVHLLLKSAKELYVRIEVPALDYAGVATQAYATGPPRIRKYKVAAGMLVDVMMCLNLLGTCCSYITFIARTMKQVVEFHNPDFVINIRIYIVIMYPVMVILVVVKSLRYLTPFSFVANILLAVACGITFSYLFHDMKSFSELKEVGTLAEIPLYFGIVIFALEGIGMDACICLLHIIDLLQVMPLENHMKDGRDFYKCFGVFNVGMAIVTLLYLFVGVTAYIKYGEDIKDTITLNLPTKEPLAQSVQIVTAVAIFITYFVQFYVPMSIIRKSLVQVFKDRFNSGREYGFRLLVLTGTVLVSIAVPQLAPVLSLIGNLCLSCLGIIFPAAIELATFYEARQRNRRQKMIHTTINSLILLFGLLVLILGTFCSIKEIITTYS